MRTNLLEPTPPHEGAAVADVADARKAWSDSPVADVIGDINLAGGLQNENECMGYFFNGGVAAGPFLQEVTV